MTLLDLHALTEISHTEYNSPHKNRSQGMRLQHVRQRTARQALNEPLHLAGGRARSSRNVDRSTHWVQELATEVFFAPL